MTKSADEPEYWVKTMRRVRRPGVEITLAVDSDPLALTAEERELIAKLTGIMASWAGGSVLCEWPAVSGSGQPYQRRDCAKLGPCEKYDIEPCDCRH